MAGLIGGHHPSSHNLKAVGGPATRAEAKPDDDSGFVDLENFVSSGKQATPQAERANSVLSAFPGKASVQPTVTSDKLTDQSLQSSLHAVAGSGLQVALTANCLKGVKAPAAGEDDGSCPDLQNFVSQPTRALSWEDKSVAEGVNRFSEDDSD